jgi:hypothetical protein
MKIYINDQGKIRGENPDYPFPDAARQSSFDSREWEQLWKEYETDLQLAKDHSIEFEDQRVIQGYLPNNAFTRTDADESKLIPGIYEVSLPEVEMVEQVFGNGKWCDRMFSGDNYKLPSREYRTVFRFVERKEDKSLHEICKHCKGQGTYSEDVAGDGRGRETFTCDYCEGTGVTPSESLNDWVRLNKIGGRWIDHSGREWVQPDSQNTK